MASWIKLAAFPKPEWTSSEIIKINNNEFARFSCRNNDKYAGKYNIIDNEWNKLEFNLPRDTIFSDDITSAFDEEKQILYIYTKQQFIEVNLKRNKTKITKNIRDIGHSARAIIINHEFHIIGGCNVRGNSKEHLIWNESKFESQFSFTNTGYFSQPGIAYISSKQSLLSIGGWDGRNSVDWIYLYNIKNRKWLKLSQTLPVSLMVFGCVVSKNQKFVIILGGSYMNMIYVLDVKTLKFRKSSIVCPKNGYFQAINMNDGDKDNLLTLGYIRNMWQCPQFNNILFPPFYLIKMIESYYSNEWIYLMEQDTGSHWKINIDHILTN